MKFLLDRNSQNCSVVVDRNERFCSVVIKPKIQKNQEQIALELEYNRM